MLTWRCFWLSLRWVVWNYLWVVVDKDCYAYYRLDEKRRYFMFWCIGAMIWLKFKPSIPGTFGKLFNFLVMLNNVNFTCQEISYNIHFLLSDCERHETISPETLSLSKDILLLIRLFACHGSWKKDIFVSVRLAWKTLLLLRINLVIHCKAWPEPFWTLTYFYLFILFY